MGISFCDKPDQKRTRVVLFIYSEYKRINLRFLNFTSKLNGGFISKFFSCFHIKYKPSHNMEEVDHDS
jgi:hypothetical protein